MVINVRESDGAWFASLEGTDLEGVGESAADAVRELAEAMSESYGY